MMEYKKITEVEMIEEPSENATVLAEDNGALKRVPYKNVGGGGGIPTAIIKSSDYDNAIAGVQTMSSDAPAVTYECINMTFDEAYAIMASGQPLQAVAMITLEGGTVAPAISMFAGNAAFGVPCIIFMISIAVSTSYIMALQLYWTADGLSTDRPGGGEE